MLKKAPIVWFKIISLVALLIGGVSIGTINAWSSDSLTQAVRKSDIEKTKSLLEQGVSPNTEYTNGVPLVFLAVESGDEVIIDLLLENGADPNAVAKNSMPLFIAAAYQSGQCSVNLLKTLVHHGANPRSRETQMGMTPVIAAAQMGHLKCLEYLMTFDSKDNIDMFGGNAIYSAAIGGHTDVIEYLISAGHSLEKGPTNFTPLMMAAAGGHIESVKLLIKNGANECNKDERGRVARDVALLKNHPDIANILSRCTR